MTKDFLNIIDFPDEKFEAIIALKEELIDAITPVIKSKDKLIILSSFICLHFELIQSICNNKEYTSYLFRETAKAFILNAEIIEKEND